MRKKDKLYTANKWNQPLFAQDNIFKDGGGIDISGIDVTGNGITGLGDPTKIDLNAIKSMKLPKQRLKLGLALKGSAKSLVKSEAGALGSAVGKLGYGLISGGLNSGAGSAISNIGGTVGGIVSKYNPVVGGIVSAASGIVGGGLNAIIGTGVNQKKLNAAKEGTNYLNNFRSTASSFDDIQGPLAQTAVQNAYNGGLVKKGWARRKNNALKEKRNEAEHGAYREVDNNINNIARTQMDNLLANLNAYGGILGDSDNNGAINYNFISDYLNSKNKAAEAKNKIPMNVFGNLPITPLNTFALGGDIQTHGSDFSNGLMNISAGGSHEENPYDGVQLGVDEEGKPNLVEEGETIFDDYVFSNRIKADADTKKKFHLGKKAELSFADISKKLEKESIDRPNDPISQAGLRKQLQDLAGEQERQKAEQQQKEVETAFAMLPPEQQRAIMEQVVMEEQQANQQAMQQQENPQQIEQMQMEQPTEEQIMQQQQMEQPQIEQPQMNAFGGKVNRFDDGGDLIRDIFYRALSPYVKNGIHTDSDFNKWLKSKNLEEIKDWTKVRDNTAFMEAVKAVNPAFNDVLLNGYDFGNYKADPKQLTFDFIHGGWGNEDYDSWNGSTDAAWLEAIKKGLVKPGMKSEEIGKALSQTDAYKKGSEWLKASEANRLLYLQSIYNSKDAPQAARDYASKFVDKNGWLKDVNKDYQTIFEAPNGTGVRNTHPGTYWKTPIEIVRGKNVINKVIDENGNVDIIRGDIPNEWKLSNSYSWQDKDNDNIYNFYKRPSTKKDASKDNPKEEDFDIVPVHKDVWGRKVGLFGPAVGLGLQALGVGKPNYFGLDAAVEAASGAPALATYKSIGDYIGYKPMDIWYEQNRMNANSRATDRAILNNNSTIGTKTAGLLANGYNSQIASGNLYRQALEYNDAQRQKVADFNRGTNMFNSQAFNQTSATNAQLLNSARNFRAQMQMDAARQKLAADASWNQGIYGNINNLFKGLGDWGAENERHNMIADMVADNIFGTITDKQNIGRGYVLKKVPKGSKNSASKGGKLNRRKGLTF